MTLILCFSLNKFSITINLTWTYLLKKAFNSAVLVFETFSSVSQKMLLKLFGIISVQVRFKKALIRPTWMCYGALSINCIIRNPY